MKVNLIKRGKIIHVGFEARVMGEVNKYSACNQRWDANDKTTIGTDEEVTCKRCKKIIEKTDEYGRIILK